MTTCQTECAELKVPNGYNVSFTDCLLYTQQQISPMSFLLPLLAYCLKFHPMLPQMIETPVPRPFSWDGQPQTTSADNSKIKELPVAIATKRNDHLPDSNFFDFNCDPLQWHE